MANRILTTHTGSLPRTPKVVELLLAANPERLLWGTDWPHPSIPGAVMPDDGHLLDLFCAWTADAAMRRRILVETPHRLFGS